MTVTFDHIGNYGRMGNALFQCAATIGYSKKYNVPCVFPPWNDSKLFNLPNNFFTPRKNISIKHTHKEQNYTYTEIPYFEDCNLFGYFQSWKYFSHCQDYVRTVLTPKNADDSNLFRGMCAIHVRRGDYLNLQDYHPVQSIEYYKQAVQHIPCKKFVVFSDDVGWCKHNFIGNEFVVSENASAEVDFRMMSRFNHFIIGNSSFSWWAAWLSEHEDKVIVCPEKWFGKNLEKINPTTDLIPEEWIKI